jgi:hypothetical protein
MTNEEEEKDIVGEDMVIIPKAEYESLKDDMEWRIAMESAGVDNWTGYDYAMDIYNGDE